LLRARQKLGKYRIVRCLSKGPLANVYQAYDTVRSAHVALKVPLTTARSLSAVEDFLHEVRMASKFEHPNILPVYDAAFIGDHFVISMPLGIESLADRLVRRMSQSLRMDFASQALAAVAHAHEHRVIHCDIKPENFIIFPGNRLRLSDFGFAKLNLRTLKASGSGTIDYIAPEQAMGRPKFQSDVFSLGLVLYQLFSGRLPEWPFDWPPPGIERARQHASSDLLEVLRRAMQVDISARTRDAVQMRAEFERARSRARRQRRRNSQKVEGPVWKRVQWREFQSRYRKVLDTRHQCRRCEGPVAEVMQACPWCGADNPAAGETRTFPAHCPRCERGVKLDWDYCAWCYGPGFEKETNRRYSDRRYTARCANKRCGGPLMPFMRYCPWCRAKVKRKWALPGSDRCCSSCGWGIAAEFWNYCAWCRQPVSGRARGRRRRNG